MSIKEGGDWGKAGERAWGITGSKGTCVKQLSFRHHKVRETFLFQSSVVGEGQIYYICGKLQLFYNSSQWSLAP